MSLSNPIVGIAGQVKAIQELLDGRIDRVRFAIIHGMGGIGKTTVAKVIFNEVSSEFQGCSFLENVRESSCGSGITKLQQQILDDVFRMSVSIHNVDYGMNEIRERSRNKKVLLVLDDVDDKDQIQKLAGMFDWFGRGSRVIVTTRDSNVIPNELTMDMKDKMQNIEGEEDISDICFYKMRAMNRQHATTLFKRHAFGADEYSFGYDNLLQNIVLLVDGLPLALAVVGSHLSGQTKDVWTETLAMLKKAPHGKVQSALMISYDSLEDKEKEIFLDIACYFRGMSKQLPILFWESIGLYPVNALNALLHKSLIEIDDEDTIWMHDQLRDLGREIVRRDGKHTRIWEPEEGLRLVLDEKGTSDVVLLNLGELSERYKFKKDGFEKWLCWSSIPSKSEAKNFSLPNLIILRLENAHIDENWTGWKGLLGSKLKILYLDCCKGLTTTPNFSTCLGLEKLLLVHCNRLTEIDGSIGKLHQLTHLMIHGLPNIKGLPPAMASLERMEELTLTGFPYSNSQEKFRTTLGFDNFKSLCHLKIENLGLKLMPGGIGQLKLLKYLSFGRCANMTGLPESVWELELLVELNLSRTGIMDLSNQIGNLKELKVLDMSDTKTKMLPESICSLTKLEKLNVSFSSYMEQIPSEIGNLFSLRILDLQGTSIAELPSAIDRLSHLQYLDIKSCRKLKRVKKLPACLSGLALPYFSLDVIPDLSNLVNLVFLSLLSNEASFSLEELQKMDDKEEVNFNQQTITRILDISGIVRLYQLKHLEIAVPVDIFNSLQFDFRSFPSAELVLSCSDAQSLSQLPPNLSALILTKFRAKMLHFLSYPNLNNLSILFIDELLTEEIDLGDLELLVNLHKIELRACRSLMRLSISSCPPKLDYLEIKGCGKLVNISGLDRMKSLHKLVILGCSSLSRLLDLSSLANIKDLAIVCCNSIESMPALPSKEQPLNVIIMNCRMLPDFYGPHDLYRGVRTVWVKSVLVKITNIYKLT